MKKKIFFILLLLTSLYSENILNDLGINVGVTSINNNSGARFNNYGIGINYQLNRYVVMPRFDIDYVKISDFSDDRIDNLFKGSINGVYEFENRTIFNPYAIGGIGYEHVSAEIPDVFESHPFIQGGFGVNYKFEQGYKAQIEGKILQIIGGNNENNEIIVNFGMNFPLNKRVKKRKKIIKKIIVRKIIVPPTKPKVVFVNNTECPIKISAPDRDRDGVANSVDQCPNTPCGFLVDSYGCPIKVTLKINFGINSSMITDYSMPKVERFAQFLLKNRGSKVLIVGHTDNQGSSASNLLLSQRRAKAVANRLLELGVSASRISSIGRGESMPIATNKTKEGRKKNRRIEAILTYPKR